MGQGRRDLGAAPVSIIILAAGRSERFGESKLTQLIEGRPILQMVIDAAMRSRAKETILVVGHRWKEVLKVVDTKFAKVVINPDYTKGMSTSLKSGIRAMDPGNTGCIVMMGDQPFVDSDLLDQLVDRFVGSDAEGVFTDYNGVKATPVLISRKLFPEIMRLRGDRGAKSILQKPQHKVVFVRARDVRGLTDIDTKEDLAHARGVGAGTG